MGLICYSLQKVSPFFCIFMAETRADHAVEIRLDLCDFDEEDIRNIFSTKRKSILVAAGHVNSEWDEETAVRQLSAAILAGADCVDIGLEMPLESRNWLMSLAMNKGCLTILSYHNYKYTPETAELIRIADGAYQAGADMVKIVTTAESVDDAARVISLYDSGRYKNDTLIAFAMGFKGVASRLDSYTHGAPLFYMAPRRGKETANGQLCYSDFTKPKEIILQGDVPLPESKSMAQRAILLAALCEGETNLYGFHGSDDTESALSVAIQLGAEIAVNGDKLTVTGHQNIPEKGLVVRDNTLYVGESGLLARLCIPLASLSREPVRIVGEKTLLKRKVSEHKGAFRKMGLSIEYTEKDYLPVRVSGNLKGAGVQVNGKHGSQMISGMLLALSQCRQDSFIHIKNITSVPYINLTASIGSYFGLKDPSPVCEENEEYHEIETYYVRGEQRFKPVGGMQLEKDWSCAAFFIIAGAMMGNITIRGLKMDSEQADAVIFDFLDGMNVDILKKDDGTVNVRKSILTPFSFDLIDCPDLFAPLVLLALRCGGESCIKGLDRLKNKESDRAKTFVTELRAIGADLFVAPDGNLYIEGSEKQMLKGGKCSSHGDHRLAMTLSLAGLISRNPVEIDDTSCIIKSFPHFLEILESLKVKRRK